MKTDTPRTDDSETRVRKNGLSSLIEYCYANDMAKLERELAAVTAQRDRLAEALQLFLNRVQYNSVFMDGKLRGGTFDYRSSGFDGEVEHAYKAIAAVKGGQQ